MIYKIYIGKEVPDEFTHGKDKTVLKGSNLKAKAKSTDSFAGARSVVESIVSAPVKRTFKVAGDILEKGAYTLADAGFKKHIKDDPRRACAPARYALLSHRYQFAAV